jgi:predicted lysophospholipase L1 biosynthesis ABC-type transport system permease subunit
LWGAISGAGFAIVLMIADRRRTFADLTVARTTMWGAVGAAAVPGVAMIWDVVANGFDSDVLADVRFVLITLAISAALGAACAAGTLRIARQSLTH